MKRAATMTGAVIILIVILNGQGCTSHIVRCHAGSHDLIRVSSGFQNPGAVSVIVAAAYPLSMVDLHDLVVPGELHVAQGTGPEIQCFLVYACGFPLEAGHGIPGGVLGDCRSITERRSPDIGTLFRVELSSGSAQYATLQATIEHWINDMPGSEWRDTATSFVQKAQTACSTTDEAAVLYLLGGVFFFRGKDYENARTCLQRTLEATHTLESRRVAAILWLIMLAEEQGLRHESKALNETLVREYPTPHSGPYVRRIAQRGPYHKPVEATSIEQIRHLLR